MRGPCPNQRHLRVDEYTFDIRHGLSGFVPLLDLQKMWVCKVFVTYLNQDLQDYMIIRIRGGGGEVSGQIQ